MLATPSDEQIIALLRKHGLPAEGPVERSPHEGAVNHVRFVGELCVRALKEPSYASDVWTESVAVPAVRASGARVPELLVFDADADVVQGLATVYRREPGELLGQVQAPLDLGRIYRRLGEQIGRWHRGVRHVEDPRDLLDKPLLPDVRQSLARSAGRLSGEELRWVDSLISRLEGAPRSPIGFVHWDLHAHNVLVDGGYVRCVLDWGDAGWGEAAINFHCFPAAYLPEALEGFGSEDSVLISRALLGAVAYALNDVRRPSDPLQPYRNHGHRRWESLQALFRRELPPAWREVLGAAS